MKILYLTQFFSASRGGGEVVFYSMAEGMAKRGHSADVICHKLTIPEENDLGGVAVHRIKPILQHKGGLPPSIKHNITYIINAILKGSEIIRRKKIDIIHSNNFSPVIAGSILSRVYNIPFVTTIHDIFTTSSPDYWKRWAAQNNVSRVSSWIGPIFEKITVKVPVDVVHTVSFASKEDLVKFNSKSCIIVIPNGIDLMNYDALGFQRDYTNYVLYIGRLVFYKNLGVVISSFSEVVKKLPDSKLIIVGDGPMRDEWEKMVSNLNLNQNIEFTGYVSHEKKVELLSKCSALVLPSLFEGFGLVLLEAFALSKPVLVADVKPYDEIIDNGIDGFVLPAHSSREWSEKIVFLLSNKTLSEKMGAKGRAKVENKYNIDNVISQIESTYKTLCSRKKT
jgi:glycosyltransferase involved in cell wall biosynthesis